MDGGQSVKRSAAAGQADRRTFHSDYEIVPEQVDQYANEVKKRVKPSKKVSLCSSLRASDSDFSAEVEFQDFVDALTPSVCSERWKNAKAEHHKTAPGMFDQTGVFVSVCRHSLVLWFTEMIKSGEL